MSSINDFDVVYISYDEPNADENWHDLLSKCPWAVRSHGVKGSDAAHKAAANLCSTNRIITVDADNRVHPEFFNVVLDLNKVGENDVISWAAKNEINGLVYGNGGIKCWPRHVIENMRTHEAAPINDKRAQVDFCWNINYIQMNNVYSHVYNNASPLQAWRAGFREGVKMTLDGGDVVDKQAIKQLHKKNYQRLLVWQTVGQDVANGDWAIYGARLGTYMTNCQRDSWDWRNVRDFEWLNNYWSTSILPQFNGQDLIDEQYCDRTGVTWSKAALQSQIAKLGAKLVDQLGLEIADLNSQGSKFFKQVYVNPARVPPMSRENEVVNEIDG